MEAAHVMTAPLDMSGGNGSDSMDEHAELKESLKIMSLTIYSLVFVLSVLGNGVVIWFTGFKMKKTVNIVWYLNLAVADFLFTAFMPLRITETALYDHWPFGQFTCKMYLLVHSLNMYASIYILMVISIDRCVCLVWPVWAHDHRSVRNASCVSLGVWALSLALSSPYVFFMDTVEDEDIIICLPTFALDDRDSPLWTSRLLATVFTQFFMVFVIPSTVIVSCYSVITYRLKRNRSLASQSGRPFKIIVAVITAFFLCWAPFHIMEQIVLWVKFIVAEDSVSTEYVIIIGVPIANCLIFLNSCLNPLLYVFMAQSFKNAAHKSLRKMLDNAFGELPQTSTFTCPMTVMTETQGIEVEHDTLKELDQDESMLVKLWRRMRNRKVLHHTPEEQPLTNTPPSVHTAVTETREMIVELHQDESKAVQYIQYSNVQDNASVELLDFRRPAVTETQEIDAECIHETLTKLLSDDFKKFKWHLEQPVNLEGLKPITKDRLEDADRMRTADLIVQTYPQKKVVLIMKNVLRKIHRVDLASKFET